MMTGLTRQALKAHPWSFAGPALTQCLAAALVTAAVSAQHSLVGAGLPPEAALAMADTGVPDLATVFVVIAVYLSLLIVGVTMASTIARQARDIALARAIGASPRQIRRAVVAQAVIVAMMAIVPGIPLGLLAGRAWIGGLVSHGVIPAEVRFQTTGVAAVAAIAVTLVTSVIGSLIAAIRPSRVRPAVALAATAAPARRIALRTVVGLLLAAAGLALSTVVSRLPADKANDGAFFALLAMCIGAGFLAPAVLRGLAPLARLAGPVGHLAADNLAVRARAYSGALVALTLSTAFATVKVLSHTTPTHLIGIPEPAADLWTDYSGTAVYVIFAAVAALNTLVTVALSQTRDRAVARLAGGTRGTVLTVVVCEALPVIATALVLAAAVAGATLVPMLHTAFGVWLPWAPLGVVVTAIGGVATLVALGTVGPTALVLRRAAIETVS
jgi:putative ABC transport system permease protein